jgi:ABC-type dipeptide/oligopeptide/nickel transport system permease subunit
VLAPQDYRDQDLENPLAGPTLDHPLGTDRLGRDLLSRVIVSSRTTVIVTMATIVAGSLILGVGLGLLSGYAGGIVDTTIMRGGEIMGPSSFRELSLQRVCCCSSRCKGYSLLRAPRTTSSFLEH